MLEIITENYSRSKHNRWQSLVICSYCGKEKILLKTYAKRKDNCGCQQYKRVSEKLTTHGYVRTKEYTCWSHIKQKCLNEDNSDYRYYGGRGILMSDDWIDSFQQFVKDVGEAPSKEMTLERRDVNGNYCKENCYWASRSVQASNRRKRSTSVGEYLGVSYHKASGKYYARISMKKVYLLHKLFDDPLSAAIAREIFIIENNLPHALNFDGIIPLCDSNKL